MFLGHFGIGFGAKKAAPGLSLGLLFLAAQFLDLIWPTLLLFKIEQVEIIPGISKVTPLKFTHYPISHSLLMVIFWSLLVGVIYWLMKKNIKYALVLALCVISHWLLDLIVHIPDLPLYPGSSAEVGMGLWNYPWLTILAEGIFFTAGILIYINKTKAINAVGKYGLLTLILLLILIYTVNLAGPPPPDVSAIAWTGHLQWLFVLFAFWIDRNRKLVTANVK